MAYRVRPVDGPLDSVVAVPGSKSVANRALMCAALADGRSSLSNVPDGDDTAAMVRCLALLGIDIGAGSLADGRVDVHGGIDQLRPGPITLPTELAGTTSRFITALAAIGPGPYVIDGLAPLRGRPMGELHDALAVLGAVVRPMDGRGRLPVEVRGPVRGANARVTLAGDVSSQFISALMLIGPVLPDGLSITITGELVSRPYLETTGAVMRHFGAEVTVDNASVVVAPTGYVAGDLCIEPDATSASYPLAAAAIVGGAVTVAGLTEGSWQGDAGFADVLAAMGCEVRRDGDGTTVVGDGSLVGVTIDLAGMSDLVPTLAVVAAFAGSASRLSGVGFIRRKESDRLGALCAELRSAGVGAAETRDGLVIEPSHPHAAHIATHHDHRLAMALALIGLRVDGIEIDDPDVVSKSWPGYWEMIDRLSAPSR